MKYIKLIFKYLVNLIFISIFLSASPLQIIAQSCQDAWDNVNPNNSDLAPPNLTLDGVFQQGNAIVDVNISSWQGSTTPVTLKANKLVSLQIYGDSLYIPLTRYSVLYRIDPRFNRPEVFIESTLNGSTTYDINNLDSILSQNSYSFSYKLNAMNNYVNFTNRPKIFMHAGQIVNITLSPSAFSSPTQDPTSSNTLGIYTNNAITNKIIYAKSDKICKKLLDSDSPLIASCIDDTFTIKPSTDNAFFGIPKNALDINNISTNCTLLDQNNICNYVNGIGMTVTFNGFVIKDPDEAFININNNYIFRYQATSDGFLDFTDQGAFSTTGMFANFSNPLTTYWSDYTSANANLNNANLLNFFYFGSYVMNVEIGYVNTSTAAQANSLEQGINLYYKISNSTPSASDNGTLISGSVARFDAPDGGGNIWFKVTKNTNVKGTIKINYTGYTQNAPVADFLLDNLVKPLSNSFEILSEQIFINISGNKLMFFPIVQSVLTLYIVIYTLYFLGGAVKITSSELIKTIAKIGIVNCLLFNVTSWNYFNDYLFQIFFGGTDYLINSTLNITSSTKNIFGFIDPLLDFYFNSNLWWLIFIEFVSFWKGTTIFAVLLIIAIINLFIVLLDLIIKYILAILSICVLISLAPLFIILILFQTTRRVFDNWISSLVGYTLEPFLMFVFFLMIQQIMILILPDAIPGASWEQLIPFSIYFSLGGYTFSIPIPGCPGLAFYQVHNIDFIALMCNTFILFCLSMVAVGLLNYTKSIAAIITGTQGLPSTQFSPSSTVSKNIGMDKVNKSWGIEKDNKKDKR